MATGSLGNGQLAQNTVVNVYAVPAGKVATYNIRIVNNDPVNDVAIRFTHSAANNAQVSGEYMLPKDIVLKAGKFFEETALMISGGKFVNLWTNGTLVDYQVYGVEK